MKKKAKTTKKQNVKKGTLKTIKVINEDLEVLETRLICPNCDKQNRNDGLILKAMSKGYWFNYIEETPVKLVSIEHLESLEKQIKEFESTFGPGKSIPFDTKDLEKMFAPRKKFLGIF